MANIVVVNPGILASPGTGMAFSGVLTATVLIAFAMTLMMGLATFGAGLVGTSPGTAYVESIAGIRMRTRTGRASVVTALCFVPCLFVAPLAAAVPGYATAAVLVLVGLACSRR